MGHIPAGTEMTGRGYTESRQNVYEEEARRIHRSESDARPGRPRIQVSEIRYLKKLLENAPNIGTVERLI